MAEWTEQGRDERVVYRPLLELTDRASRDPRIQEALDAVESLEARLGTLVDDPRLAKRLRRTVRQDLSLLPRETPPVEAGLRPGLRPPSPRESARYVEVATELDGAPFPRDAADLAHLHGRLTGDGRIPFRMVPAELRGTSGCLVSPEPAGIPLAVDRALRWASDVPAHPAVVASLLAGDLLAIRPFKRGDALLSRLLMRMVLLNNGLGTIGDLVVDRKVDLTEPGAIDTLLDAVSRGTPESWVVWVLEHLKEGLEEALADAVFAQGYLETLNERQWRIADWFRRAHRTQHDRSWRFRDIHAAFNSIPPRTLKRDLATLRQMGILEMEGKLKSARYRYVAEMTTAGTAATGMS